MGNALGKHVISLYATKISQVGKIKDIKKLQQNIVREGSEGREGKGREGKEGRKVVISKFQHKVPVVDFDACLTSLMFYFTSSRSYRVLI